MIHYEVRSRPSADYSHGIYDVIEMDGDEIVRIVEAFIPRFPHEATDMRNAAYRKARELHEAKRKEQS